MSQGNPFTSLRRLLAKIYCRCPACNHRLKLTEVAGPLNELIGEAILRGRGITVPGVIKIRVVQRKGWWQRYTVRPGQKPLRKPSWSPGALSLYVKTHDAFRRKLSKARHKFKPTGEPPAEWLVEETEDP